MSGSRLGFRVPGREVNYLPHGSQTSVSRRGAGAAEAPAQEANTEMLMAASSRPRSRFLPTLERLEDRLVPTVTYHGGTLLPHVEVQGMYLGSDWYNISAYYN